MAYKISDFAMMIESDGKSILVAESAMYEGTLSIGSTIQDLPSNYFTDYFASTYTFQGSTSGYTSGGDIPPVTNIIDKFPFSTDTNASDVGDLTVARKRLAGHSSTTHGYASGGPPGGLDVIERFPFSSNANATDVGNLLTNPYGGTALHAGHSSETHGYASGGEPHPTLGNVIQKFSFATATANATDVGDLTVGRRYVTGTSATNVAGYSAGGQQAPGQPTSYVNTIDKFPFTSDANATDVGDLLNYEHQNAGTSSTTHGYHAGSPTSNVIQKYSFSSDGNATDVGDLVAGHSSTRRAYATGQSSTNSGYVSGGSTYPPYAESNIIEKFPFSTDANSTDVGDLTGVRIEASGQQV